MVLYPEIDGKPSYSGMICLQGDRDAGFLKSVIKHGR